MSDERYIDVRDAMHVCTVERMREVAARYGIEITGTLSPITTAPVPMTDEQVAGALRLLEGIPPGRSRGHDRAERLARYDTPAAQNTKGDEA